ncbi:unnamed protein product [Rhizoctonia solani]|uniref:Laminin domain protein n=1 Tax=Rhizoctonia solani TaxID=456999 RepID=A0A8H3HRM6_9AGAM|nr:unnamed protein product [Rhizoctonia solani]
MADHLGWYPPSQVCYPPGLPASFKNVYDLKPIVGVPSDAELIGIHTVIHAANRISGVPGMHDPGLFMKLADHLFNVQMAKYRSKYSLITFPSDATYAPPALPAHIAITLEPVLGAPSDEDIVKVQDAVRAYQHFSSVPSMFNPLVNMELSQHLFDIQMARYMRHAGENQPIPEPQVTATSEGLAQIVERAYTGADVATNNAGTGAVEVPRTPQPSLGVDVRELIERSNQLAERFNQLLERSNELVERSGQTPADQSGSQSLAERFNQVVERLTQLIEQSHQPTERSDQLTERFNELFERFNQLTEQSHQPAKKVNELAEQLNRSSERSNQFAEQANKSVERLGDLLVNTNKVLAGVQHAIVRNHKGNMLDAVDCLINDKGEMPGLMHTRFRTSVKELSKQTRTDLPVTIDGVSQSFRIPNAWLGDFLWFYGIGDELRKSPTSTDLKKGQEGEARNKLSDYLSSCLG